MKKKNGKRKLVSGGSFTTSAMDRFLTFHSSAARLSCSRFPEHVFVR